MEMRAAAHTADSSLEGLQMVQRPRTQNIVFNALSNTFGMLDSFYTVLGALSERWLYWGGQVKKSRAQFGKLNSWLCSLP